jgi:hypothetical protein
MPGSAPKLKPLTSPQWQARFQAALAADLQTHGDLLIQNLCSATDNTMAQVADHIRRYVTDFWKGPNEDRSLRGAEMRRLLPSAIAGQKTTIKIFEKAVALVESAGLDPQEPARINAYAGLEKAQGLLLQLETMSAAVPATSNVKSLGYAGDLQTLHSLDYLLRYRLGKSSFDTLATLIDCGHEVEGHAREAFGSGENLKKRLAGFREKHAQLAEQTEARIRKIPRQ